MIEQFTQIYNDNVGKFYEIVVNNIYKVYDSEHALTNVLNFLNEYSNNLNIDIEYSIGDISSYLDQKKIIYIFNSVFDNLFDYYYVIIDIQDSENDHFLQIRESLEEPPTAQNIRDMYNLHLHILQSIKKMD